MESIKPPFYRDRSGALFEIGEIRPEDLCHVMDMYQVFTPRPASQGLPPADPDTCREWVTMLLDIAANFLALRESRVIGHAALIPDEKVESGEFVIFVHQDFRNLGIGTALSKATLERAKTRGFKSVWLTVSITNFIAARLYRKIGFEYCDMDDCERKMIIML